MDGTPAAGTQMTSREFNQATGEAKTAARRGPVFVTNRGQRTHVLMTYENYQALAKGSPTLVDLLCATAGAGEIELPLPERTDLPRLIELS